ncbi:MAG TPA: membrane dipeptidase [Polyangiaceae bacterium]|nr:membrane dipeptidase [Polyangiaceae bacterium]
MIPELSVREAPAQWAQWLGISREAVELYARSDVVDLHFDSFIWARTLGYDLGRQHDSSLTGRWFGGHVDLPRAVHAGVTGATWVITTNPFRSGAQRADAFRANLKALSEQLVTSNAVLVRTHADYVAAQAAGRHAAFIGIQGGNAVDDDVSALDAAGRYTVLRVTVLHLTRSSLGLPSTPRWFGSDTGLTPRGKDYVAALNERRVFVDLAHISPKGFYDALDVHDRSQPALVTHTGVSGVHRHWRNLDDEQLRRIAATGGTVGIMFHGPYLGRWGLFGSSAAVVFRHLEHAVQVAGEDHVSLGSDWDGAIVPPSDLSTCSDLPRLVQLMLDHHWSQERIQKVLGLNFLRALRDLRG